MSISAGPNGVHNEPMTKTSTTATVAARGRGAATGMADARRRTARRDDSLTRALDARRGLQPRSERFAHLKRMHD